MSTTIGAKPAEVWKVISDIEKCSDVITGINKVEILEKPTGPSIVGLKWEETRTFMGKEATEIMWVTEAKDNEFYHTRAESHGAIYKSGLSLEAVEGGTKLTMSFEGIPQTFGAKLMWLLTGWMAKGHLQKTIAVDLEDIKRAVESA